MADLRGCNGAAASAAVVLSTFASMCGSKSLHSSDNTNVALTTSTSFPISDAIYKRAVFVSIVSQSSTSINQINTFNETQPASSQVQPSQEPQAQTQPSQQPQAQAQPSQQPQAQAQSSQRPQAQTQPSQQPQAQAQPSQQSQAQEQPSQQPQATSSAAMAPMAEPTSMTMAQQSMVSNAIASTPTRQTSRRTELGIIFGSIGAAVLVLGAAMFYYYRRKPKRKRGSRLGSIENFSVPKPAISRPQTQYLGDRQTPSWLPAMPALPATATYNTLKSPYPVPNRPLPAIPNRKPMAGRRMDSYGR